MKQIDKRILQAGIAHIEMFVVGIVALGLVGVLGFVGYNAWQNSNGEKRADAGTSGFVSSRQFCESELGRELDRTPSAQKQVGNKWKVDNGWGLCKKKCLLSTQKLVSGSPYDRCKGKSSTTQSIRSIEKVSCPSGYKKISTTQRGYNCRSSSGKQPDCGGFSLSKDKCRPTAMADRHKSPKDPSCKKYGKGYAYSKTKNMCHRYKKI